MNQHARVWRVASLAVSCLLLLVFFLPSIAIGASRETPLVDSKKIAGNTLVTPTIDPTITALQKELLNEQIIQLKDQNFWSWTNATTALSILGAILATAFGLYRWLGDRRAERQKRAEESFQSVVESLGSERAEARVGAAVMLRTFLRPHYEKFYNQVFTLAVAHLRFRKVDKDTYRSQNSLKQMLSIAKRPFLQENEENVPDTFEPLDSLSQALVTIFTESFPSVRDLAKRQNVRSNLSVIQRILTLLRLNKLNTDFDPRSFDATGVRLDRAYLAGIDLRQAWMQKASLREADLTDAKLTAVNLTEANLEGVTLTNANLTDARLVKAKLTKARLIKTNFAKAQLVEADLTEVQNNESETDLTEAKLVKANLTGAKLINANLTRVDLTGARLTGAFLSGATLTGAILIGAILIGTDLTGANLTGATLDQADLTEANLSWVRLAEANPENASSLKGTRMIGVSDLSPEQRIACEGMNAIFENNA